MRKISSPNQRPKPQEFTGDQKLVKPGEAKWRIYASVN